MSFRFSYDGAFDGSEENIHFSEDIERDIVFEEPEPGQAYVSKSGTFDEETGKKTLGWATIDGKRYYFGENRKKR